jgi:hypothetical protein
MAAHSSRLMMITVEEPGSLDSWAAQLGFYIVLATSLPGGSATN